MRVLALGYLAALLAIPVAMVCIRTFERGIGPAWEAVTTPPAMHAFWLTLTMVASAVSLNTIFGIGLGLALVRGRWRGKTLVSAIVDLPFAVSPVVVGLALILVYGNRGWIGSALADSGTLTLFVEQRFQAFDLTGAYAASVVLAVLALAVIATMTLLDRRKES